LTAARSGWSASTLKTNHARELAYRRMPQLEVVIAERLAFKRELERAGTITAHVFSEDDGSMLGPHADAWKSACTKAGAPGRLVHDLRRSAARNMIKAGVSEKDAMAVTGHETRSMFDHYHITNDEDVADALAKVAAMLGGSGRNERVG